MLRLDLTLPRPPPIPYPFLGGYLTVCLVSIACEIGYPRTGQGMGVLVGLGALLGHHFGLRLFDPYVDPLSLVYKGVVRANRGRPRCCTCGLEPQGSGNRVNRGNRNNWGKRRDIFQNRISRMRKCIF